MDPPCRAHHGKHPDEALLLIQDRLLSEPRATVPVNSLEIEFLKCSILKEQINPLPEIISKDYVLFYVCSMSCLLCSYPL